MSDINYLSKKSAGMVWADVEANCVEHGIRGRLKHEDIEKMVAHYTDDEKHARIHGKFHHLVGLIFKNFNRKVHVIKPFNITEREFVVLEVLDPHPRNPDAVMWMAIDKNGTKIIVDELYNNFTTPELAKKVITKADRFRILGRWADPSAFVQDQHQTNPEAQTLAGKLWDLGLQYQKATKDRRRADRRIKDAFDFEMKGEDMLNAPEIYIFDTCVRTIWEVEHYQWDDWRGKAAERKSPMEKPMDKDDHMIENLGRLLVQEAAFAPMLPSGRRAIGVKVDFDPFA